MTIEQAMNPTIEEAIQRLEGMVFTSDLSPNTLRAIAVNKMSLAALRECAERRERAADVAPVVHGKWILVGANAHHYEISVEEKCSVCSRYVYRYDTQPQDTFCPSCGAKMDGGDT